jgi:hypothetical protein
MEKYTAIGNHVNYNNIKKQSFDPRDAQGQAPGGMGLLD